MLDPRNQGTRGGGWRMRTSGSRRPQGLPPDWFQSGGTCSGHPDRL